MKILISGADGFLGTSMKACLDGHDLYCLSRNTGHQGNGPEMIYCDLGKSLDFASLPGEIDIVIHLAQSRHYRSFPEGMEDMLKVNVDSTLSLLEYARRAGAGQFILASTGSLYEPGNHVLKEEDPLNPVSGYAVSKYCAEMLTRPYAGCFNVAIGRLFFLYGPGQENMMIPNLIKSIQEGREVFLQGTEGGLLFCPTFVDDVSRIIGHLIDKEANGVFNIASPELLRLKDVAEQIGEAVGKTVNFSCEPDKTAAEFRPSLEALGALVDMNAQFLSFREGIARTIDGHAS